jgi:anthranilate phosphoribosyltransferase
MTQHGYSMIDELKNAMNDLLDGQLVSIESMTSAVGAIMDGRCSEAEIASFLTALRCRGESVSELVGAAKAMRQRATPIVCRTAGLLDTCGTGGDLLRTFNISTAAAIVAAAAGQPVAKHGNRSATSTSGSADVLEALGINLNLSAEQVGRCIDEVGIGFCFAPLLHTAMKHVGPVRKQLGFRTIFNMLGPLTNPAKASFQLIGTIRTSVAELMANALSQLGCTRALVVCGNNELDEVSLWGQTVVFEVAGESVKRHQWDAHLLGLHQCHVESLRVDNSAESASLIRAAFTSERGPGFDMIVANSAAALFAADKTPTIQAAVRLAKETIESGAAAKLCEKLVAWTNANAAS